jgi:hypothetical protein
MRFSRVAAFRRGFGKWEFGKLLGAAPIIPLHIAKAMS